MKPCFSFRQKKVLLISPHADDETAGCGGSLARAANEGAKTFCLVLSVGDLPHEIHQRKITRGATRKRELAKAIEILGVADWEVVFEENELYMKLDTLPRQKLIGIIEREARLSIQKIQPNLVLIPHPSSHQDHQAVYEACLSALRPHHPQFHYLPETVLVYEAPQASWSAAPFLPQLYLDITDYLQVKKRAFRAHRSQSPPPPHPFCWANIERLAKLRGAESGFTAAEAFSVLRMRA